MVFNRTSLTDRWDTPFSVFKALDDEFHFTLDPCASSDRLLCSTSFLFPYGLYKSWSGHIVFMNPPYGKDLYSWVEKACLSASDHSCIVVCLLPSYTGSKWFHDFVIPFADDVRFIRGRLKFGASKNSAPFDSVIVVFR